MIKFKPGSDWERFNWPFPGQSKNPHVQNEAKCEIASPAGVFRRARISSLPSNACSTENNIPFSLFYLRGDQPINSGTQWGGKNTSSLKTPSGEAKCETFVVKMSVICIRIKKIIFVSIAWHLASIWNRGLRQIKNGLLVTLRLCEKKIFRQEWPRPGFMSQRDWAPNPNPCFY